MHALIGLSILIGVAAFVTFAFRQGMGVRREHREDNMPALGVGSDSGPHNHADGGGFGHG
jgi:hypothetical protein